jgi:hypothetical protein
MAAHRFVLFGLLTALLGGAVDPARAATSGVVAEASGVALTVQTMQAGYAVYDFFAGRTIAPADRDALRAQFVAAFNRDPKGEAAKYPSVRQLASGIAHGFDPLVAAQIRERLWDALASQSFPEARAELAVLKKYQLPIAEAGGLLVTPAAFDALVASDDLVADLTGYPKTKAAEKTQLAGELARQFATLSASDKAAYSHAESRHFALVEMSRDRSMHESVMADLKRMVHARADVPRAARAVETDSVDGLAKLAGMRRDLNRYMAAAGRVGVANAMMGAAIGSGGGPSSR